MSQGAEKLAKAEAEVERLRSIVSHMENEKNEQEGHIRELQEQVKESNKKMASLKRSHQAEKKKTAQMLEEVRRTFLDASTHLSMRGCVRRSVGP